MWKSDSIVKSIDFFSQCLLSTMFKEKGKAYFSRQGLKASCEQWLDHWWPGGGEQVYITSAQWINRCREERPLLFDQAEPDSGEEVGGRVQEALKRGRAGWHPKAQRGSSWEPAAPAVSRGGPEREEGREAERTAGQTTGSGGRWDAVLSSARNDQLFLWEKFVTFSVSGHPCPARWVLDLRQCLRVSARARTSRCTTNGDRTTARAQETLDTARDSRLRGSSAMHNQQGRAGNWMLSSNMKPEIEPVASEIARMREIY